MIDADDLRGSRASRENSIGNSRTVRGGRRLWLIVAAVVVVVLAVVIAVIATSGGDDRAVSERSMTIAGVPEGTTPVSLDASLFLPATLPAPAVILAHGFGVRKTT